MVNCEAYWACVILIQRGIKNYMPIKPDPTSAIHCKIFGLYRPRLLTEVLLNRYLNPPQSHSPSACFFETVCVTAGLLSATLATAFQYPWRAFSWSQRLVAGDLAGLVDTTEFVQASRGSA
jgi:hypothetical protein